MRAVVLMAVLAAVCTVRAGKISVHKSSSGGSIANGNQVHRHEEVDSTFEGDVRPILVSQPGSDTLGVRLGGNRRPSGGTRGAATFENIGADGVARPLINFPSVTSVRRPTSTQSQFPSFGADSVGTRVNQRRRATSTPAAPTLQQQIDQQFSKIFSRVVSGHQ